MAIGDFTGRTSVLPLNANGMFSFFDESRVIQNRDGYGGLDAHCVDGAACRRTAYIAIAPRRSADKMKESVMAPLYFGRLAARARRNGLDALAFAVPQNSECISRERRALFDTLEVLTDGRFKILNRATVCLRVLGKLHGRA